MSIAIGPDILIDETILGLIDSDGGRHTNLTPTAESGFRLVDGEMNMRVNFTVGADEFRTAGQQWPDLNDSNVFSLSFELDDDSTLSESYGGDGLPSQTLLIRNTDGSGFAYYNYLSGFGGSFLRTDTLFRNDWSSRFSGVIGSSVEIYVGTANYNLQDAVRIGTIGRIFISGGNTASIGDPVSRIVETIIPDDLSSITLNSGTGNRLTDLAPGEISYSEGGMGSPGDPFEDGSTFSITVFMNSDFLDPYVGTTIEFDLLVVSTSGGYLFLRNAGAFSGIGTFANNAVVNQTTDPDQAASTGAGFITDTSTTYLALPGDDRLFNIVYPNPILSNSNSVSRVVEGDGTTAGGHLIWPPVPAVETDLLLSFVDQISGGDDNIDNMTVTGIFSLSFTPVADNNAFFDVDTLTATTTTDGISISISNGTISISGNTANIDATVAQIIITGSVIFNVSTVSASSSGAGVFNIPVPIDTIGQHVFGYDARGVPDNFTISWSYLLGGTTVSDSITTGWTGSQVDNPGGQFLAPGYSLTVDEFDYNSVTDQFEDSGNNVTITGPQNATADLDLHYESFNIPEGATQINVEMSIISNSSGTVAVASLVNFGPQLPDNLTHLIVDNSVSDTNVTINFGNVIIGSRLFVLFYGRNNQLLDGLITFTRSSGDFTDTNQIDITLPTGIVETSRTLNNGSIFLNVRVSNDGITKTVVATDS